MEWIITTPEMSHSGILNMHWGRRRYQNKDGSLTPEGKKRYAKKAKKRSKNERLMVLLEKAKKMANKNGIRTAPVNQLSQEQLRFSQHAIQQHNEMTMNAIQQHNIMLQQNNAIQQHNMMFHSENLEHSGILGMHWGRRRYQNKDGSWTEAGKRRRREMSPDAKKRASRKNEAKNLKSKGELDTAKANLKITKAQNKAAVQEAKSGVKTLRGKIADKAKATAIAAKDAAKAKMEERKAAKKEATAEEIIRSGDMKKILQNKDKLTNEQLKAAADRMDLEQRLSGIDAKQKQAGIDKYKRFADVVGTTANLTSNGITTYNNLSKILGTFGIAELPVIDSRANREKAAYDRDANAERLRTLRATADTAEANARRAQQDAPAASSSSGSHSNQSQSQSQSSSNSSSSNQSHSHSSSDDSSSSSNQSQSSSSNSHTSPTLRDRLSAGLQRHRDAAAERRAQQHANRWTQEAQDDLVEQAGIAGRTNQRVRDMRYRAQTSGASEDEIRRLENLERATEVIAQYRGNQYAEYARRNPTGQTRTQAARNAAVNTAHRTAEALRNVTLTRAAREASRETAEHRARQAQQQIDDAFRLIGQTDLDELERRYRTYSSD